GDAAEYSRAGFALRLVFERKLVADVDVRIEESRQHDLAAGVEHVLRRCGKLLADGGNAAAADADVRRHRADAGHDQRAVADDEIEGGARDGVRRPWGGSDQAGAVRAGQATGGDVGSVAGSCVYPTAPAVASGSIRYGIFRGTHHFRLDRVVEHNPCLLHLWS